MLNLSKIRIALVGVGNCASSLIQGLIYYQKMGNAKEYLGVRYPVLGGFDFKDIDIVAAFDIDQRKVGRDLSEAIFAQPNNTLNVSDVPRTGVVVSMGSVLDGVGEALKDVIPLSKHKETDAMEVLRESKTEIVINLLPSGAVEATQWYAEQALKAGCAFVNATPVRLASESKWSKRFENANLPLVGDDLIDQVGSTTLHKILLTFLSKNGARITETYQLDVGGGTESLDTSDRTREIKRELKTEAIESALPYKAKVVAGSTDYVDFLKNKRDSYFWIKGTYFCNTPMQIDLKLSTVDAPNAGSVLIDVIRAVKIALNKKLRGTILPISAYAFKRPPKLISIETAEQLFAEFIKPK